MHLMQGSLVVFCALTPTRSSQNNSGSFVVLEAQRGLERTRNVNSSSVLLVLCSSHCSGFFLASRRGDHAVQSTAAAAHGNMTTDGFESNVSERRIIDVRKLRVCRSLPLGMLGTCIVFKRARHQNVAVSRQLIVSSMMDSVLFVAYPVRPGR